MKEYIEKSDGSLLGEGMSIPADISNRHYREFLELKRQGQVKVIKEEVNVWAEVKSIRNGILSSSDWTQIPDNGLSSRNKSEWRDYRNRIRNITKTFNKPEKVVWPSAPST